MIPPFHRTLAALLAAACMFSAPLWAEDVLELDLPLFPEGAERHMEPGDIAAVTISEQQIIRNEFEIAYVSYHAAEYSATIQQLNALLRKHNERALYGVRYLLALSLEHAGGPEEALQQYARIVKDAPRGPYRNAAFLRTAACQLRLGRREDAIYTFRDIIDTAPSPDLRLQACMHLADLYLKTDAFSKAKKLCRGVIGEAPGSRYASAALFKLAECETGRKDYAGAIRCYAKAVKDPAMPPVMQAQALMRMGDTYMLQGKWAKAISAFREIGNRYPQFPELVQAADARITDASRNRLSE